MSGIQTKFDFADKRIKDYNPQRKHLKVLIGSLALFVFMALIVAMLIFMAFIWSTVKHLINKPTG